MDFLLVCIWLDAGCVGADDVCEMATVGAFVICGSRAVVLVVEGEGSLVSFHRLR